MSGPWKFSCAVLFARWAMAMASSGSPNISSRGRVGRDNNRLCILVVTFLQFWSAWLQWYWKRNLLLLIWFVLKDFNCRTFYPYNVQFQICLFKQGFGLLFSVSFWHCFCSELWINFEVSGIFCLVEENCFLLINFLLWMVVLPLL